MVHCTSIREMKSHISVVACSFFPLFFELIFKQSLSYNPTALIEIVVRCMVNFNTIGRSLSQMKTFLSLYNESQQSKVDVVRCVRISRSSIEYDSYSAVVFFFFPSAPFSPFLSIEQKEKNISLLLV